MVVGALDPLEGSLLILPGSGIFALGTWASPGSRRWIAYRLAVFGLIAIGVGALWGLSQVGGFGGRSGRSNWWGVLVLPYLVGWSMGIWGPGSPRWLIWLGIGVSLWYFTLTTMILVHAGGMHRPASELAGAVLAAVGLLTIGGCVRRLCLGRLRNTSGSNPPAGRL